MEAHGYDREGQRRGDLDQRFHGRPRRPTAFGGCIGRSHSGGDEETTWIRLTKIHKSLDGTRVANYAQWRSKEAFEAMLRDREAAEHMGEAAKIAERFEPHLYEVSFVDENK